jgi:glucosaminylphosphatidylinositol acyltransferase
MIIYEFSLLTLGLKYFVFYGPRNDFISANREGVVSSFGYLAVCLVGIEIGRKVFQTLYDEGASKADNDSKEVKIGAQRKREITIFLQMTL